MASNTTPPPPRSARLRRALALLTASLALAACEPAPPTTTTTSTTTTSTTTTTTVPAASVPPSPPGWRYLGGDEFDGAELDGTRWKPYHNTYGDSNLELACLTPANVAVSGGSLRLTARQETVTCPGGTTEAYTSGFVGSREVGRYYPRVARFEVRAKVPHAQGLWPAFWLRHRGGAGVAEVDVMEYFHAQVPGKATQTLHLDGRTNLSKKTTWFEAPTTSTPTWHTWAVEILPDPSGVRFRFEVDGVLVHTYLDEQHRWTATAPEDGTWDIALNLAVGGRWVGRPGDVRGYLRDLDRCSIGGTPPANCTTTGINDVDWRRSTYEVDYVRVYVPSA